MRYQKNVDAILGKGTSMKFVGSLALLGVFAVSACGGGTPASLPAMTAPLASRAMTLDAYRLPLVSDARIESAARAGQAALRFRQNSYGGVPTADASAYVTDAPKFGPGAQVNLAIVEVDSVSEGGMSYPIVQYDAPVIVNVLEYQQSALNLGSATIPAILYKGVELVVDPTQSYVLNNGTIYPMVFGKRHKKIFTPTVGLLAGVYYTSNYDATKDPTIKFLMDFNTNEWIALKDGVAEVAPKGHAASYTNSIAIVGSVLNKLGAPVEHATVQAVDESGSVAASSQSKTDGSFELHALDAGSYTLVVQNTYDSPDLDGVIKALGNTTDGTLPGLKINVSAGNRLNVGQIQD